MQITQITPDQIIFFQWGPLVLNATIVYTWVVMALLVPGAWLATRRLSTGLSISRWQNLLEVLVQGMRNQIREVSREDPERYLPFVGTLFVLIVTCNILAIVPGFHPPTGSLSTTAALAICVFVAVPVFGITRSGFRKYLSNYVRPSVLMLPFNLMGELSRTLALAVRLFGNVMSGVKIAAILLAITPLFVPIPLQALSLLTGLIQAYIFAVLALVYIVSAVQAHDRQAAEAEENTPGKGDLNG